MSKNALIIDHGFHFKQISHCAYLWKDYKIDAIIPKPGKEQVVCEYINKLHLLPLKGFSILLSFYIFFVSFKYDKFIFLTGPEYGKGFKFKFNMFLFYTFSVFFRKQIVVYVKNTSVYQNNLTLQRVIRNVAAVFFESKHQMDYFLECIECDENKCKVAYVYYPDFQKKIEDELFYLESTEKIKVGLIGQFDKERRDYNPLIELLSKNDCRNYTFYQIGRVAKGSLELKNELIGKVNFIKDDYTSDEVDYLIQQMDVLLSMNSINSGYSKGKGTAAFSEAISAKKRLIIPKFLDVYYEFKDYVIYYENCESLLSALKESELHQANLDFSIFSSSGVDSRNIF